jgi:hypothetical protein
VIDEERLAEANAARDVLSQRQHDLELATAEYHHRIRQLYVAGGTLREIADELELSHQRVHQIVDAAGFGIRSEDQPPAPPPAGLVLSCSFCGASQKAVAKLIAGPGSYICNGCVGRATAAAGGAADELMTLLAEGSKERCSFCSQPRRKVDAIVAGGDATICNECLDLCAEILRDEAG